ncbi:type II secretion system minor pseudopilin GspH [Paraglaciecola sp. 2405UD69-4]|uniref:type II secretion system minor pseudopilin GspH n=1 Tax=Paraglaciecola sp. 2405UD69-4 TaxID=3391836 RepID=UPI0039C92366
MFKPPVHKQKQTGFTLIEVMLVLLIMGLAVGAVVLNYSGESAQDRLKKQAQRLQVVFNMAADFAVLNQRQLGLRVEEDENTYYFMYLDQEQTWQKIEEDRALGDHILPEEFSLELSLTDLPWDTSSSLFSNDELFEEDFSLSEDGTEIGNEEDKKPEPPQVFIFSSGEITPFSLSLIYEADFGNAEPVYFRLNGQDTSPIEMEGPLDEL